MGFQPTADSSRVSRSFSVFRELLYHLLSMVCDSDVLCVFVGNCWQAQLELPQPLYQSCAADKLAQRQTGTVGLIWFHFLPAREHGTSSKPEHNGKHVSSYQGTTPIELRMLLPPPAV